MSQNTALFLKEMPLAPHPHTARGHSAAVAAGLSRWTEQPMDTCSPSFAAICLTLHFLRTHFRVEMPLFHLYLVNYPVYFLFLQSHSTQHMGSV